MKYITDVKLDPSFIGIWKFEYYRDYHLSIEQEEKLLNIKLFDETWNEECIVEITCLEEHRIDFWAHCSYDVLEFSIIKNSIKDQLVIVCSEENIFYKSTNKINANNRIKPFKDSWYEEFHSDWGNFPNWCAGEWCPEDGIGHISIKRESRYLIRLAIRASVGCRIRLWFDAVGRVNSGRINFTAYPKAKTYCISSKQRPIRFRISFPSSRKELIVEEYLTIIGYRVNQ